MYDSEKAFTGTEKITRMLNLVWHCFNVPKQQLFLLKSDIYHIAFIVDLFCVYDWYILLHSHLKVKKGTFIAITLCVNIALSLWIAGSPVQWWNWQADRVQNQVTLVHAHSQQWWRDHWSCSGHQQEFKWRTLHWRRWKGNFIIVDVSVNAGGRSCAVITWQHPAARWACAD